MVLVPKDKEESGFEGTKWNALHDTVWEMGW
jgi:hypothetical protein